MKCPHCLVEVAPSIEWTCLGRDADGEWGVEQYLCPNLECQKRVFYLVAGEPIWSVSRQIVSFRNIKKRILIRPKGANRPPVPSEVLQEFPAGAEDYTEACLVLPDSPKASAALSRRCLQHLLREKAGVKHSNLADEIQQVIDSRTLPSLLAESIDAIRNIGNFAAHPIKSEKSGEIVAVEPGEAEWNLDVLEGLFDFYFVQPVVIRRKRKALDEKLKESGQKPMK
jgi:hypothetical protein